MRRLVLAITLTACLGLLPAAASASATQPTVTAQEDCPVLFGQQIYGIQATFTGLPPDAVFIFSFDLGGITGDADIVSSDAQGTLVRRVGFGARVKFIAFTLTPLFPAESITPLSGSVKKPCKHAAKRSGRA